MLGGIENDGVAEPAEGFGGAFRSGPGPARFLVRASARTMTGPRWSGVRIRFFQLRQNLRGVDTAAWAEVGHQS